MLGHASAAMTLDRYTDLSDDDVADRLDALHAMRPKGLWREWRRGESNP